mmetsp:Transcript_22276/g.26286  ORF Transcript_22276/g.26286 Transcript_22276/m.26286 type:complete len:135 (+) Transcript_22276:48-452(+)
MKSYLSIVLTLVACLYSTAEVSYENAHDSEFTADYCSEYLCGAKAVNTKASNYLTNGCDGSFPDYLEKLEKIKKVDVSEISTTSSTKGISTSALVGVSGTIGLVGMVIGFLAGRRERPQNIESIAYSPVPASSM